MFGEFEYPIHSESAEVCLSIENAGGLYVYRRRLGSQTEKKVIGGSPGRIIVNPVEPINLPREVTRYLEFHFTPVVIGPDTTQQIFLKFPVEIGVFLESRNDYDILDIFSLVKPKYALYGDPENGIVTRHIDGQVFEAIPPAEPLKEGVMALTLKNSSRSWVEISRAVFENTALHIYYGELVSMVASLEVFSRNVAETTTEDRPLVQGQKPAIPLFKVRKSFIPENIPFLMESGVGE